MPRQSKPPQDKMLLEFVAETKKQMFVRGITVEKLAPSLLMKSSNLYAKFAHPEKFTLKQLMALYKRTGVHPFVGAEK